MTFTHTFQDNTLTYSDVLGVSRLMFLSNSGQVATMFLLSWMFLLGLVEGVMFLRLATNVLPLTSRPDASRDVPAQEHFDTHSSRTYCLTTQTHNSILDNDPLESHEPRRMFLTLVECSSSPPSCREEAQSRNIFPIEVLCGTSLCQTEQSTSAIALKCSVSLIPQRGPRNSHNPPCSRDSAWSRKDLSQSDSWNIMTLRELYL